MRGALAVLLLCGCDGELARAQPSPHGKAEARAATPEAHVETAAVLPASAAAAPPSTSLPHASPAPSADPAAARPVVAAASPAPERSIGAVREDEPGSTRPSLAGPTLQRIRADSTAGYACFTWRRGHDSTSQCYASTASCNAERRAAPVADELGPCRVRSRASCTYLDTAALRPELRCFGDGARCEAFRAKAGTEATTPCAPGGLSD